MFVLTDNNGLAYNIVVHWCNFANEWHAIGASGNIVLRLASTIPDNQSHKLFFDNWFTSVDLQVTLQKKKIHSGNSVPKLPDRVQLL